jgi:hypothetical protein
MGDSKKTPRKTPRSPPHFRSVSRESLRKKMSELISLRERVAQAKLAVGDEPAGPRQYGDPNGIE